MKSKKITMRELLQKVGAPLCPECKKNPRLPEHPCPMNEMMDIAESGDPNFVSTEKCTCCDSCYTQCARDV
jgi:hypothetical protein